MCLSKAMTSFLNLENRQEVGCRGQAMGAVCSERKSRLLGRVDDEAGADRELLTLLRVDRYQKGAKLKF